MTDLYRRVEPKEGELVQFLAVYALGWPWDSDIWPTAAFVEAEDPAPALLAALERIARAAALPPGHVDYLSKADMVATARAALAAAKGA